MSVSHVRGALPRLSLIAVAALLLVACGSTKVITADRSIVYRGDIYSLANVSTVSSKLEAIMPGGEVVDVMRYEKRAFNDLIERHGKVTLRSTIEFDDRDMLYEQKAVDRYRDFEKLQRDIGKAMSSVQNFMADPKKTQLNL
jgi:hypothetical protein